jgi:Protein of unknown function (DUF3592)
MHNSIFNRFTLRALLIPAGIGFIYAYSYIAAALKRRKLRVTVAWPQTQGKIVNTRIKTIQNNQLNLGEFYVVYLSYSYSASGDHTGSFDSTFTHESIANDFAHAMDQSTVTVHYNPEKANHSLLRPEELRALLPEPLQTQVGEL